VASRTELLPRSDGARYRRLTLTQERDGAVVLHWHDMGGGPGAAWGLDDEEVTLRVPADQVGRLALALATELLNGRTDAVAALSAICEEHGVDHQVALWT
jgi:hypothetical protein